jgi:hypothetical protein
MEQKHLEIPEKVQQTMKLESIFLPHLRKKREIAYQQAVDTGQTEIFKRFVHYTSAEAALDIIRNKRIWMRKTMCMSDYREVEHGFEILWNCFHEPSNLDKFTEVLDSCAPGAAKEAIDLYNKHLTTIRTSTYIASISEHKDEEDSHGRLSMWRAFGGTTGRVAIVLTLPWYKDGFIEGMDALKVFFSPIAYLSDEKFCKEFQQVISNISEHRDFLNSIGHSQIVNYVFYALLSSTVCLKHSGFNEELEWRVLHFPNLYNSPLMKAETKVINGIPQKVYLLPLDAQYDPALAELDVSRLFDRLIIGPTEYAGAMYETFSEALADIGIPEAYKRVFISNIPIRT